MKATPGLGFVIAMSFGLVEVSLRFVEDDAYISCRYANNLTGAGVSSVQEGVGSERILPSTIETRSAQQFMLTPGAEPAPIPEPSTLVIKGAALPRGAPARRTRQRRR